MRSSTIENVRVKTRDRNKQNPVRYIFRWALREARTRVNKGTLERSNDVLEFPRGDVGFGAGIMNGVVRAG